MNKRLVEIHNQTMYWVADNGGLRISDRIPTGYTEKFAELIVKECMTQIQEVREIKAGHAGPEYTQGFDDGMFVAISTIEEHFGVEE
jgi:hypothetical protein